MFLFTLQILQDTELQVVVVGAGRADLVAQTKVGIAGDGCGPKIARDIHFVDWFKGKF